MSNFEQKKKMADEVLLVANDFLRSNLAKEILLKDDEITPKQLNPKIEKELESHLDINAKFLNQLKKEELPSEIFDQSYKEQIESAQSRLETVKNNITNEFNFNFFDTIFIGNDGKYLTFNYKINEKFVETLSITSLVVTDLNNGKDRVITSRDVSITSGIILGNWGIYPGGNYAFFVTTNNGQKIKVNIK